jgi:hypothetical protein
MGRIGTAREPFIFAAENFDRVSRTGIPDDILDGARK